MKVCKDFHDGLREIDSYIEHFNGLPLIVGIDDPAAYTEMLSFLSLEADKEIVRVSDNCTGEQLPNPNMLWSKAKEVKPGVNATIWIGASQAVMLYSYAATEELIIKIAGSSVASPVVVLCPHINAMLTAIADKYRKLAYWFVMISGNRTDMPAMSQYLSAEACTDSKAVVGLKGLLRLLEDGKYKDNIAFISSCTPKWFTKSVFPFRKIKNAYELLCETEPTVKAYTKETDGTDEQWSKLLSELNGTTLAELCEERLGSVKDLPRTFGVTINTSENGFLCYVALKLYTGTGSGYLSACLSMSKSTEDLTKCVYNTLLSITPDDERFARWRKERKEILQGFEENHALEETYCELATIHKKDVLYYLNDTTESGRAAIIHAICTYDYSRDELLAILNDISPNLALYLGKFTFDQYNTRVSDSDMPLLGKFTEYFDRYKIQKVSNYIAPEFLSVVEQEAAKRSFTHLQTRSSIIMKMDKSEAVPFFFDAMGVEYLSFIQAKCEQYGIQFECQIGQCNLPSITIKNEEFYDMFPKDSIRKESGLDEVKHKGIHFDYRITKEPIHVYEELDLLEKSIKKFSSWLRNGTCKRIVMISDHGTSRLAVTYESENEKLALEEKGQHSGRCCPCKQDPEIEFVYYDDHSGYAVLANYERFRGSRKADVETHGGATLEETLVPVITLSVKNDSQQAFFVEDTVQCNIKTGAEIRLFANPPLDKPHIIVNGIDYPGVYDGDKHNVVFAMPDIRRKGHYEADIFNGAKKIVTLGFDTIRTTKIVDDF